MQMRNERHYNLTPEYNVPVSKAVRNRMSNAVNIAKAMYSRGATSHGRTFNCTFAYRKSKLLAIGTNDYRRTVRYLKKFKTDVKYFGEDCYRMSLHGEISCLLKLGYEDCSDIDFFSIRINKNGKCCPSKPCNNCSRILNMVGFKHVYFFDNEMTMKSL